MRAGILQAIASFLLLIPAFGSSNETSREAVLAPGYGPLAFSAPRPGSYSLPRLGAAADGKVLDEQGRPLALSDLMGDKIVLLSFIYSTCSDVNGCPLATAVFHQIKNRLSKEPEIASRIRLLTLSFNPAHDTPEVMKRYGSGLASGGSDWRFLTTASETNLKPILEAYRQSVVKEFDETGHFKGTFSHILRVLLIDRDRQIRNIFSVSFLHADVLINDIKTLLDSPKAPGVTVTSAGEPAERAAEFSVYRAGDDKNDYDSPEYRTRSIALPERAGEPADLLGYFKSPPLGLPAVPLDPGDPITPEKIKLGRKLFYDRRLSGNQTFSCAMCHIPEQGFTSNEMATSVGVEGRTVRRNAPTLYNVAYAKFLFHDGRESALERQVWGPMLAANEMANPSIGYVIDRLRQSDDYPQLFAAAYGKGPDMINIGNAIASYQRTLNSANSPFDRWKYGGVEGALEDSAKRGFQLFTGKAGCASCHLIGQDSALFSDDQFHDTGVGFRQTMQKRPKTLRLQVAPGAFLDVDEAAIASVRALQPNDLGRYEITGLPQDRWKYKTPTLRNIALTAPYMHDGSLASLKDVIDFYNRGGIPHDNLDPLIRPLSLSANEIEELVAFLESLTGDNIAVLVSDAFAVEVGVAE